MFMQVVSVNISSPKTIVVNGVEEQTGIFKKAIHQPIFLGETDVENDSVIDRIHHGGTDKACYLYGLNHYNYWKEKYPNTAFEMGMFGENITLNTLDEATIIIGAIYKIGNATIQVSQPRQPCYKLGFRFNNQKVVKQFRLAAYPGIYVRVLNCGAVKQGDAMELIQLPTAQLSVLEVYKCIYKNKLTEEEINTLITNDLLAENVKKYVENKFLHKKKSDSLKK